MKPKEGAGSLGSTLLVLILLFLAIAVLAAVYVANPGDVFVEKPKAFTEEKFSTIQKGMSREEVATILGEPVEVKDLENGGKLLLYARPWPGVVFFTGYEIYLDSNDIVMSKYVEF